MVADSRIAVVLVLRRLQLPSLFVVTAGNSANLIVAPATPLPVSVSISDPWSAHSVAGGGDEGADGDDDPPQAATATRTPSTAFRMGRETLARLW